MTSGVELQASQRRRGRLPDFDLFGPQERRQPGQRGLCLLAHRPQRLGGDHPELRRRIVEQGAQRRNRLGGGLTVTPDHFRGRKPHLRVFAAQLSDDGTERTAAGGPRERIVSIACSLHSRIAVIEHGNQVRRASRSSRGAD